MRKKSNTTTPIGATLTVGMTSRTEHPGSSATLATWSHLSASLETVGTTKVAVDLNESVRLALMGSNIGSACFQHPPLQNMELKEEEKGSGVPSMPELCFFLWLTVLTVKSTYKRNQRDRNFDLALNYCHKNPQKTVQGIWRLRLCSSNRFSSSEQVRAKTSDTVYYCSRILLE